ncbi:MAG: putative transporter [Bacteroidales bacterium]|jgi:putative transport protein|nr:putative transporter [Bacteroidales bacterium]OQC03887.1 MAG: Aspartate/alanine antiporter [Bacteroidetes bacterium ADurb.Bin090]MBP8982194.1 putative transporter [Bacteroidales bacterium]NLV37592.1 putative transporter [Bacteroidales bacterium]HNZ80578.1 putative transporter [Bacteroidales bacterium]
MTWLTELIQNDSVARTILILAVVISSGIYLGKIKIFGISLGITWVLFVGLILGHFGFSIQPTVLHFIKEFGLILFVYSIGMQVGPGFFSSFKQGGIRLNMLAVGVVLLGVLTVLGFFWLTDYPMTTLVGIMSGAVTNTPGLGAAQQAYLEIYQSNAPDIALGYAVAYPLGVVGVIGATILIRILYKIKFQDESRRLQEEYERNHNSFVLASVELMNPALFGKTVEEIHRLSLSQFVISRVLKSDQRMELCNNTTKLEEKDKILIATDSGDLQAVIAFFGKRIEMDWDKIPSDLVSRRILLTKTDVNGKTLGSLHLRKLYGVNVTRVNRSGMDLLASPSLVLQMGDRLMVVGSLESIQKIESLLGNSLKRLREPNLIPIFLGIFLGVLLGSVPIRFPGIPQAVKLGLAGGPLIVAILISRFGPKYGLLTYTTMSANLMLRELGITLFLCSVGIGAGDLFVETVFNTQGLSWLGIGLVITVLPPLIVGILARSVFKLNYLDIMGLLSGSMTDPPALAYANSSSGSDQPVVAYSTVYPLTMFLRVLCAQILILIFA